MFAGKIVAITGGAGGIGQALCRYFADQGAAIAALDKSDEVERFAAKFEKGGPTVSPYLVDVGNREAV